MAAFRLAVLNGLNGHGVWHFLVDISRIQSAKSDPEQSHNAGLPALQLLGFRLYRDVLDERKSM